MGRRRKQDIVTAFLELFGLMLTALFTLLVVIIKVMAQIFSALIGLLRKKQPHTLARKGRSTLRVGSGRQIYEGLKKEYSGPTGKSAKKYFLDSCARTAITSNLSPQLLNYIRSENLKGRRPESIAASVIRKLPGYDKADVERIVRTVMGIADTAFERSRSQELDIEWYIWQSSRDARVRASHQNMDGVLVAWNEPPPPEELIGEISQGAYHAGAGEDCRCIALPVLSLDDIKWPVRVYSNGRIVSMKRKEFQKLSSIGAI
jgi:SPP1 gp7 family putative phage head morphogenesis protein